MPTPPTNPSDQVQATLGVFDVALTERARLELEVAPRRLPDLFAGSPVLVGLRIDPAGRLTCHVSLRHTP